MTWLRSARTADGARVDVELAGGRVAQVVPAGSSSAGSVSSSSGQDTQDTQDGQDTQDAEPDLDLTGHVLLPSFVEPHAHLDKALTVSRAANPTGDLLGAITAMRAIQTELTAADYAARANAALRTYLAHGTTAVRTHVDVGAEAGMVALAALVEVREAWRGLVDLQLVALVSHPLAGAAGADLRRALREGADVAGGCPFLDEEPAKGVAICLDAAGEAGVPLDLHTDETLDPAVLTLDVLADLVARTGFEYGATASHCVSLAAQPPSIQLRLADRVAAAGIAVVALPQTNLYLQGWDHPVAPPRGLTAIGPLRAAGATVAAGGDNLRDPFNPVGRADPCETAALMVACGHLDGPAALDTVTAAPRRALGLPPVGLVVGAPADLIALPAADALEALAAAPAARTVWRAGRIAARTTVTSEIAAPRPVPPASTSSVTAPTSTASAGTARPARPDRPERRPFQEVDS